MAEVLDIIQRINYEANASPIEQVSAEFQEQFKQISQLQAKQASYQQQIEKAAASDTRRLTTLNALLERNKRQQDAITESVGRTIAANERLSKSVVDATGKLRNLSFAGSQLLREAPAFAFSIQTGILALSNNIPILLDQLKAARGQGATTAQIFKSLGASIFSLSGIITIAVSALTIFGGKLFDTAKEAKEANKELSESDQIIKDFASSAAKELSTFQQLTSVLRDNAASYQDKKDAISELRRLYPEYLKNIKDEELFNNNATEAYNLIIDAIYRKARAMAYQNALNKLLERELIIREELDKLGAPAGGLRQPQPQGDPNVFIYRQLNEEEKKRLKNADAVKKLDDELTENRRKQSVYAKEVADNFERVTKTEKERQERQRKQKQERDKGFIDKLSPDGIGSDLTTLSPGTISGQQSAQSGLADIERIRKTREGNEKKAQKTILDNAKITRDILLQYINDVARAQTEALDREIALRQQNLSIGLELAKRGNTEVLREEQRRLDEAQAKREEIAQRQLQIDAILRASSLALTATKAIETVANAGATGDPYTIAIRIAAAVAALTAGFAAVSGLVQSFRGFSEGGYTGDGGKYEAKGVVHAGEYVMPKEQTAKYRPLLERLHKGKGLPSSGDRTDDLIGAIKENKSSIVQDFKLDEYGFSIYTQKNHARATNRWRH